MIIGRKTIVISAVLAVCLLAAAAMSRPGRAALNRVLSPGKPEPQAAGTVATPVTAQALAQQVKARHGWGPQVLNSVVSGQIAYYDQQGQATGQVSFTLTRKYPEQMRLEIQRGAATETVGFAGGQAWKAGKASLTPAEARAIRAWLRCWPERLFTSVDAGATYRYAGERTENFRAGTPWQGPTAISPAAALYQVEVADTIGSAPTTQNTGDQRAVYYYIDESSLVIQTARWLEPDNPSISADNPTTPKMDVRVDYESWMQVGGVMWPAVMTHWLGGKVDYRITLTQVQVNSSLLDSIFLNPNQ